MSDISNTLLIVEAVKHKLQLTEDAATARALGVSKQALRSWRSGDAKGMRPKTARRGASILGRNPGELMALAAADSADDETDRKEWTKLAAIAKRAAAAAVLITLGSTSFQHAKAVGTAAVSYDICILCKVARMVRRACRMASRLSDSVMLFAAPGWCTAR